MFASLKNKIKEETGTDPARLPNLNNNNNNNRVKNRRFSSTISVNSNQDDIPGLNENDNLSVLRSQCNELSTKVTELESKLQHLHGEKVRVEKTNEILLESVKVAQTQKDLVCNEQEKIHQIQQQEIDKLTSLLSFREQEAMDRIAAQKQSQQQIENLTMELERLRMFEPMVEDIKDELERLRHTSTQGKNHLTSTLAAVEEENRLLKMRLKVCDEARLDTIAQLSTNEKVQALVQERKLLEQHLEEAYSQLSDVKSSWSGQNLALETQVSRLSKQVAEETTEKRKVIKERDDLIEKVKHIEFEMQKLKDEIDYKNERIKLIEDDFEEMKTQFSTTREENEQEIVFERNKSETLEAETKELKSRLAAAHDRFTEYSLNAEKVQMNLRQQNQDYLQQLQDIQLKHDNEREEKLTALLKNAEISQKEELLRKELRLEKEESQELHEKLVNLETSYAKKEEELTNQQQQLDLLKVELSKNEERLKEMDSLKYDLCEKNKTIKVLDSRLADLKKTVQRELRNTISIEGLTDSKSVSKVKNGVSTLTSSNEKIIMDEVNFKYLKHVIVKFLTSREVEARHLIRAVSTLLKLTKEEEKLLHDTLNWKMSWFGAKPHHGSGQHAISIPPS